MPPLRVAEDELPEFTEVKPLRVTLPLVRVCAPLEDVPLESPVVTLHPSPDMTVLLPPEAVRRVEVLEAPVVLRVEVLPDEVVMRRVVLRLEEAPEFTPVVVVRRVLLPEFTVEPDERRVWLPVPLDVVRLFCEEELLLVVALRFCEDELPLRVDVERRLSLEELLELEERRLLWDEEPPVERVVLVVLLFWVERLV